MHDMPACHRRLAMHDADEAAARRLAEIIHAAMALHHR